MLPALHQKLSNKMAIGSSLVFLLAIACACSLRTNPANGGASESAPGTALRATSLPADESAGRLDFALTNAIGTSLSAVYISPSDSPEWQENVLAGAKLDDGETLSIRFRPQDRTARWDLRIESAAGIFYAEWKGITLRDVSRITVRLNLEGKTVMVAEVE